ncbi:MAG: protein translocase subunit SecF [Candidatus Woesearchaeota archaeon]
MEENTEKPFDTSENKESEEENTEDFPKLEGSRTESKERKEDRKEYKNEEKKENKKQENRSNEYESQQIKKPIKETLIFIYKENYKKLLIIPFILLILAIAQIGYQTATTGDFINKGISLKGGIILMIPSEDPIDIIELRSNLMKEFSDKEINVRDIESLGSRIGIAIEADIDENNKKEFESFISSIENNIGKELTKNDYSVEFFGSSLGESFFRETAIALLLAFVFMGIVVFAYFRTFVPSAAVILASFSNIIVTVAVINLLGVKISTAGIAGFLMLIGYSVDTDILLSTRVLKRTEGSILQRTFGAMKTGIMMTLTTLVAVTIAYLFSQSDVLHQIMLIIIIGLLVDLINTWIQNAGILRWYLEIKSKKSGKNEL